MPPDLATRTHEPSAGAHSQVHSAAGPAIDFRRRVDPANLPELMDEPCTYEQFRACVHDIASVSRWTLGYRPTLRFLAAALDRIGPRPEPVHVLDVGSGGGDTLRKIALGARPHGLTLQLTGIDLNPHATRAATEFSAGDPRFASLSWCTGDVFTEPVAQSADLVLSSLVTHHMRDGEIVRFLRWMEDTARFGWFISDLLRSAKAYRLFGPFASLMRWHPFVQNDGLVSIRRAFRQEDWQRLLEAADIPLAAVAITEPVPGRLCVARLR